MSTSGLLFLLWPYAVSFLVLPNRNVVIMHLWSDTWWRGVTILLLRQRLHASSPPNVKSGVERTQCLLPVPLFSRRCPHVQRPLICFRLRCLKWRLMYHSCRLSMSSVTRASCVLRGCSRSTLRSPKISGSNPFGWQSSAPAILPYVSSVLLDGGI